MAVIHDAKNRDYARKADPFSNFRACEAAGISATDGVLTRMSDKWERLVNLIRKEREGETFGVFDESIEDTLLDLANYAVILACLRVENLMRFDT